MPSLPARWLDRPHKGAHELAVHLRRDRVHIDAFPRKNLPRVFGAIDPCRLNVNLLESRGCELAAIFVLVRARPPHSRPTEARSGGSPAHFAPGHNIGNRKAAARLQHAKGFPQYTVFVGGKVDHTIRDNDVHRVVGQRNMLDLAPQELDVLRARFALVLIGQRQHLVRHIETIGLAGGPDPLRRKQNIHAAARAEIEDHFPGIQFRQRRWISATERGEQGLLGNLSRLGGVVQIRSDWVAARAACRGGSAAGTAALFTRKAAWPYFSLMTLLMSVVLIGRLSYLQSWTIFCGLTALFRVQHSA